MDLDSTRIKYNSFDSACLGVSGEEKESIFEGRRSYFATSRIIVRLVGWLDGVKPVGSASQEKRGTL